MSAFDDLLAWEERLLDLLRCDEQLLDRIIVAAVVNMQATGRGW